MNRSVGYKVLNGTTGAYGHGDYSAYMPHGKRPGKWLPKVKPVLGESGYHYCENLYDVPDYYGDTLTEVEVRGEIVRGCGKAAAEQLRILRVVPEWNERTMRLDAVDCARIAVNRYARADQCGLLHACLDVATAYADDPAAWAAAMKRAAHSAADSKNSKMNSAAYSENSTARWATRSATRSAANSAAHWAAHWAASSAKWAAHSAADSEMNSAARWAARREQAAILARYLNGEQGPFVKEGDA